MHYLAHVQAKPKDPEVAILQLSSKEHDALHHDALGFINANHVFSKQVREVQVPTHLQKSTGMAIIVHMPNCTCRVTYCCASKDKV